MLMLAFSLLLRHLFLMLFLFFVGLCRILTFLLLLIGLLHVLPLQMLPEQLLHLLLIGLHGSLRHALLILDCGPRHQHPLHLVISTAIQKPANPHPNGRPQDLSSKWITLRHGEQANSILDQAVPGSEAAQALLTWEHADLIFDQAFHTAWSPSSDMSFASGISLRCLGITLAESDCVSYRSTLCLGQWLIVYIAF